MKDGRTHLAHKAEHGIDLETGAILSVTVQEASEGDSATLPETLTMAAEQVEAVQPDGAEVEEVVADKGYHSDAPDRALGASDGLLGLPMDAGGAGRLNRSSPSCLNRSAQRIDFFHGLLSPVTVRSRISSRSNSASAAKMPNTRWPAAVVVSICAPWPASTPQAHAAGGQVLHGVDQMGEVAAEAVELPDDEHVALPQGAQAAVESRPVVAYAGGRSRGRGWPRRRCPRPAGSVPHG